MNIPINIARKYFLSRRTPNAIHVISGISVIGIAIGTAALILVLSVFNGFESLISGMMSHFNSDIKIGLIEGKTFQIDSAKLGQIKQLPGVSSISCVLEEKALFEYEGSQDFGTLKGVDNNYLKVSDIESAVTDGVFKLQMKDIDMGVVGAGLGNKMGIDPERSLNPITIYAVDQNKAGGTEQPFKRLFLYPSGLFSIQQDIDYEYVLASLPFVQDILNAPNMISGFEVKLSSYEKDQDQLVTKIENIVGKQFYVKNRYQQEESFMRLMNMEKWVSFAILSLTLLLVVFNMMGALWMIVLEKRPDISILRTIGLSKNAVKSTFLWLGSFYVFSGFFIGLFMAVLFYILQLKYGLIGVPDGFAVDSYPILMKPKDIIAVALVIFIIALFASWIPSKKAAQMITLSRND